jgi:alpha-ketoglutarate-dependent taurine dioxygenase
VRLLDLPGTVGSELLDVDLSVQTPQLTAADVDALRARWDARHLLLVPGSQLSLGTLSGEQQMAFVARFGRLICERRPWSYVSNVRADAVVREGALLLHSDFAFARAPVEGISLHALEVPTDGAPTVFADACAAVDRLPVDLRARLSGLAVLNCFDFGYPTDKHCPESELTPGSPRYTHPVIGHHPRTGEPVIFANQMHSDHLVGLPAAESVALLGELFDVLYDPAHLFVKQWHVGDLALWDNVALHHGRDVPPADAARTLQRVTLGDYTPSELVANLAELLAQARTQQYVSGGP